MASSCVILSEFDLQMGMFMQLSVYSEPGANQLTTSSVVVVDDLQQQLQLVVQVCALSNAYIMCRHEDATSDDVPLWLVAECADRSSFRFEATVAFIRTMSVLGRLGIHLRQPGRFLPEPPLLPCWLDHGPTHSFVVDAENLLRHHPLATAVVVGRTSRTGVAARVFTRYKGFRLCKLTKDGPRPWDPYPHNVGGYPVEEYECVVDSMVGHSSPNRFAALKHDPVPVGCSIGSAGVGTAGTLGAFIVDDQGGAYALTCSDVAGPVGAAVMQPSPMDVIKQIPTEPALIGRVAGHVGHAALITVNVSRTTFWCSYDTYRQVPSIVEPAVTHGFGYFGRTSGLNVVNFISNTMVIACRDARVADLFPPEGHTTESHFTVDAVLSESHHRGFQVGDGGACISLVDDNNNAHPSAMIVASAGRFYAFAIPVSRILAHLGPRFRFA